MKLLNNDGLFNGLEPTVLVAHTLHFGTNSIELIIDASSYLLSRSLLLAINPAKLVVQAPGHGVEVTTGPAHGAQVAEAISAAFPRRHRCLPIGAYFNCPSNLIAPASPRVSSASLPPTA